jgi:hypothetical protein
MSAPLSPPNPEQYRSMSTEALLDLYRKADGRAEGSADALQQALRTRQTAFSIAPTPSVEQAQPATRKLAFECNAVAATRDAGRIELRFPTDGCLRPKRTSFKHAAEVPEYLAEIFASPELASGGTIRIKRTGKYRRVNAAGESVFTFGDPILDAITTDDGWITIGHETYHVQAMELSAPALRGGGVSTIDLDVDREVIQRQLLQEAVAHAGPRSLVEHNADRTIIASTNPSVIDFFSGSAHMRFRSWKRNYIFYRSIGTDIETWGGKFNSASIESMYADPIIGGNPFVCGITKRDRDSDTNDDYVDEYEAGVFANPATSVRSQCRARWKNQDWGGTVGKGDCQQFL